MRVSCSSFEELQMVVITEGIESWTFLPYSIKVAVSKLKDQAKSLTQILHCMQEVVVQTFPWFLECVIMKNLESGTINVTSLAQSWVSLTQNSHSNALR